jgi:hypothetical protein
MEKGSLHCHYCGENNWTATMISRDDGTTLLSLSCASPECQLESTRVLGEDEIESWIVFDVTGQELENVTRVETDEDSNKILN